MACLQHQGRAFFGWGGAAASAVFCLLTGVAWIAWRAFPPVERLVPGDSYAVDVYSGRAALDLDFREGTRYTLIVGSLGSPDETHHVSLTATGIDEAERRSVHRLEPLVPDVSPRPPTFDLSRLTGLCRKRSYRAASPDAEANALGDSVREFALHVTDGSLDDPSQYTRVRGRVVAEGERVRVYLDCRQQVRELSPGVVGEIVRLLDQDVIPATSRLLGGLRDVDGDGKFAVLLTPWLNHLQGGRTSLGGFVRGSDFRTDLDRPFSNHCDMLYLNSQVQPGEHLRTLLAHELTHAVCFSERLPAGQHCPGLPDEDDWLNEAVAHVSENLQGSGWSNLDYRVSRYLSATAEYPLVVQDYYRADLWRSHGCRGATYLFLRWCVDQFGPELLPRLVRSPASGTQNLERVTGVPFEELFRRWSLALFQSGRTVRSPTPANNRWTAGAPSRADRGTDRAEGYRSLDLRQPLSKWGLAGPRPERWDVDSGRSRLSLQGTAVAFVEVRASGAPGVRRLRLAADYGTRLQVSIVKHSRGRPRLRIEARPTVTIGNSENAGPSSESARATMTVAVTERTGSSPVTLQMLSCERNGGETKRSLCFTGDELPSHRVSAGLSRNGITRYVLPVPDHRPSSEPLVVKAVAVDAQGRRAAAWCVLDPTDADHFGPGIADVAAAGNRRRR